MAADTPTGVLEVLRSVIAPLIEKDGGALYVVAVGDDEVSLHLAGTCSGCPGVGLTSQGVIEPVVHGVAPRAKLYVTNGWQIPKGAKRVVPR
ncbi:MAG: NifU family protein [Polyangiaceae bacterium]|nr:NifU family protein [Polyangiaceae bacterium]